MAEQDELVVEIADGIISNFKADVVVNSTNIDLYLNTGALSKAILRGAGKAIQTECNKAHPNGVEYGEVVQTKGYKLPCKNVYHGALPIWKARVKNHYPKKMLCEFICNCLEKAHADGVESIAFPTLGCGFLNYPPREVAIILSNCIALFKRLHDASSLKAIYIVVYTKGQDWRHIKQAFMQELGYARIDMENMDQPPGLARGNSFSAAKIGAKKAPMLAKKGSIIGKRCLRSQAKRDREEAEEKEVKKLKLNSGEAVPGSSKLAEDLDQADGAVKAKVTFKEVIKEPIPGPSKAPEDEGDTDECESDSEEAQPQPAEDNTCKKTLACGHACSGVKNEESCPPCLKVDCEGHGNLKQGADDDCLICYTDELCEAPVLQLGCGHVYHYHCVLRMLENKWVGTRISFNFMTCPMCKKTMEHALLDDVLKPLVELKAEVRRKGMMRLQYEGLDKCDEVTNPESDYHDRPEDYAMDRYCYYPCYKCEQAYFGGIVQCEQAAEEREFQPEELVCPSCSNPDPKQSCDIHGNDELEYKCRYCCSVAVFYCHGTTHYCDTCHRNYFRVSQAKKYPKCPAGPNLKQLRRKQCPLNIKHPPTGEEFALGCGICKNTQSF